MITYGFQVEGWFDKKPFVLQKEDKNYSEIAARRSIIHDIVGQGGRVTKITLVLVNDVPVPRSI
jgi:hypothetical protein